MVFREVVLPTPTFSRIQTTLDDEVYEVHAIYMQGRILQIKLSGFLSYKFDVVSGVVVNDIRRCFGSKYLWFADDIKLFRTVKSSEYCDLLQRDLDSLADWCLGNNIKLNVAKCSYSIQPSCGGI